MFNIYASDEYPIFVRELQEIDDFFDQLDPNIDVIWGTATDDTLGEDAKVTILATGLEDSLSNEVKKEVHHDEDDYYEDLIKLLYKPTNPKPPTISESIVQTEIDFDVAPAPEPEPPIVEPVVEEEIVPKESTTVTKLKAWLDKVMKSVVE